MRTVQMTLDEDLVKAVDKASKRLGTTRSEFTRRALREPWHVKASWSRNEDTGRDTGGAP